MRPEKHDERRRNTAWLAVSWARRTLENKFATPGEVAAAEAIRELYKDDWGTTVRELSPEERLSHIGCPIRATGTSGRVTNGWYIGDDVMGEPVVIAYDDSDKTVFVSTNEGDSQLVEEGEWLTVPGVNYPAGQVIPDYTIPANAYGWFATTDKGERVKVVTVRPNMEGEYLVEYVDRGKFGPRPETDYEPEENLSGWERP